MTEKELIDKLNELNDKYDTETAHAEADRLLLNYINNDNITKAFDKVNKWYS